MGPEEFQLRDIDGGAGDDILTFELVGDVDIANHAEFERAVTELLDRGPLVLDLSPATYLDSAGFAALDRLLGRGHLELVMNATCLLRKAATIVGVPFHDDVGAARGAIARPNL
jgi:anti-sigma B factor antagonist